MNSVLNINIRVISGQARAAVKEFDGEMKKLSGTAAALNRAQAAAAGAGGAFSRAMGGKDLVGFGKNLQWTGRQLEYSFTLPVLAAGGAATKWALDNERAMTSVRKVYGDFGMTIETRNREVASLAKTFELL